MYKPLAKTMDELIISPNPATSEFHRPQPLSQPLSGTQNRKNKNGSFPQLPTKKFGISYIM
jgi:hypothetical protein